MQEKPSTKSKSSREPHYDYNPNNFIVKKSDLTMQNVDQTPSKKNKNIS